MTSTATHLALLADYLALVYHEARNVRHLIHAGFLEPGPWARLTSLPVNREKAWSGLQSTRTAARKAQRPCDVLSAFERRFQISLQQLIGLYGHQAWRGGAHGGNAWKGIAQLVSDAAEHLEANSIAETQETFDRLAKAHHNTGLVGEKLHRLDRVIESAV
jgi:hypothetical protein